MSTSGELLDHTPLCFGKYKGRTPSDVAEFDPSYIVWLGENCPGTCSAALVRDCERDAKEHDEGKHRGSWGFDDPHWDG